VPLEPLIADLLAVPQLRFLLIVLMSLLLLLLLHFGDLLLVVFALIAALVELPTDQLEQLAMLSTVVEELTGFVVQSVLEEDVQAEEGR